MASILETFCFLYLDNVSYSIYNYFVITKKEAFEFIWDKGNIDKNLKRHGITNEESEEAFFDENKVIIKDVLHSEKEKRYILLGKTKKEKLLYVVFTVRGKKIRIISARVINKKEVSLYEKAA